MSDDLRPINEQADIEYLGKRDDWLTVYDQTTVVARAAMSHLHGHHADGRYQFCVLCGYESEAADRINALTAERDRLRDASAALAALCRSGSFYEDHDESWEAVRNVEAALVDPEPPCATCEGDGVLVSPAPCDDGYGDDRTERCPDCTEKENDD